MATSFLSSETCHLARWTLSETKNGFSSVGLPKAHAFKARRKPINISLWKGLRVAGGCDFCFVLFLVLLCFGLEFQGENFIHL